MKVTQFKCLIYLLVLYLMLLLGSNLQAQNTLKQYPKVGIFNEILIAKDQDAIRNLQSNSIKKKLKIIDSVIVKTDSFNPEVLFELSNQLFALNKKDTALFYFCLAQLRTKIDFNTWRKVGHTPTLQNCNNYNTPLDKQIKIKKANR